MPYVPSKNGTLLIPSGVDDTKHLFFIVTKKCAKGDHLLVNVTTIYDGVPHDDTCVVGAGEHPFIKHPSYINYRVAERMSAELIEKRVGQWYFKPDADASEELIKRILNGFENSDFTKKRILDYLDGGD